MFFILIYYVYILYYILFKLLVILHIYYSKLRPLYNEYPTVYFIVKIYKIFALYNKINEYYIASDRIFQPPKEKKTFSKISFLKSNNSAMNVWNIWKIVKR